MASSCAPLPLVRTRGDARPTIHSIMIATAKLWSLRSTCCKHRVGAVLAKNDRIVSVGYNGVPPKQAHCSDYWEDSMDTPTFREDHRIWSLSNEIHAEENVIIFAARTNQSTDGCIMYTTRIPCYRCAGRILQAGIVGVYYLPADTGTAQTHSSQSETYLKTNGIFCEPLPH